MPHKLTASEIDNDIEFMRACQSMQIEAIKRASYVQACGAFSFGYGCTARSSSSVLAAHEEITNEPSKYYVLTTKLIVLVIRGLKWLGS